MNKPLKYAFTLGVTTALSFCVVGSAIADFEIAPPGSTIAGDMTYPELGARWGQWAFGAPGTDIPIADLTGAKCAVGQQGSVWFLAGAFVPDPVVRDCEVPIGKALFFPIVNATWLGFPSDPPEQRNATWIRDLLSGCEGNFQNFSVIIDGEEVANPEQYLSAAEDSPVFQIKTPTDGYGPYDDFMFSPNVHTGVYLYVEPLSPGPHTISWTGEWNCGSQDITYNLTVLEGVTNQAGLPVIGENVKINRGVQLGDFVEIGDDTTIGRDTVIGDHVTIGTGVEIGRNVVIEDNVTIGNNAQIGRNATITMGSNVPPGEVIPRNSTY